MTGILCWWASKLSCRTPGAISPWCVSRTPPPSVCQPGWGRREGGSWAERPKWCRAGVRCGSVIRISEVMIQERIHDFHIEGAQKNLQRVRTAHILSELPLRPGFRVRLRALEALGPWMLYHAIWVLFVSILIQRGWKKHLLGQIGGGGGAPVFFFFGGGGLSIILHLN